MLEIRVFDEVTVDDSLEKIIEYVVSEIKQWHDSNDERPFTLKIERQQNKAPPSLEINVSDTVKVKSAFG